MPPPLVDDQIGFASVSLTANVFTQLPDIPCKEIWIGNTTPSSFTVGGSATPGANAVFFTNTTGALVWMMIPTGGNAKNLFFNPGATPGTLPFLWRNPRTQLVGWAA